MPSSAESRDVRVTTADVAEALGSIGARMRTVADARAGLSLLQAVGELAELPRVYWVPDVSHLDQTEWESFAIQAGWPQSFLEDFRGRQYILRSRLAIRCRIEQLPFASTTEYDLNQAKPDREDRTMLRGFTDLGILTLITVPVHLPRAQVSIVGWGGPIPFAAAQEFVSRWQAELMVIGQYFANRMEARYATLREPKDLPRLTKREQESLRLLASGLQVPDIARLMEVSRTTARFHLDNAREKLGAASQPHAVALAAQLGLLGTIGR